MASDELLQQAIDKFWETVPMIWGQVRNKVRMYGIAGLNITPIQFHILRHMRRGACSVGELAEYQQISRPAISQAVDQMVEEGLITRQQRPHDRRFVQLTMTERGTHLLNSVFSKNRQWMAKKMAGLDPEELETIIKALTYLKKTFESGED